MTPEEFRAEMQCIQDADMYETDKAQAWIATMSKILKKLGYRDGVRVMLKGDRLYLG